MQSERRRYLGSDIDFDQGALLVLALEDGGGITWKILEFVERRVAGVRRYGRFAVSRGGHRT